MKAKALSHHPPNKPHKPFNISLHACLLQGCHILLSALYGNHHPGITGRYQLAAHHETRRASTPTSHTPSPA